MAKRLLFLFDSLNKLGTTVVVATHDLHLLTEIQRAEMLRLDRGQIADPDRRAAPSAEAARSMKAA